MKSSHIRTKKVHSDFRAILTFTVVLWIAIGVGCQPITTTPISPSSTFIPPTPTIVSGLSTDTWTQPSTLQAPTPTPTIVPSAEDEPIVLVGTLIDGTGAKPLIDAVIIIQDGFIACIGSRKDVDIPPGAKIIEFHNATLLPGFINSHVHSTYEHALLEKWVQAGVTTVRDLGARYPFFLFSTRDKYNKDPDYATLISAGPLITVPGGYPLVGSNFPSLLITNPNQARRAVTQLISDGADIIKIVVDSGEGLPILSLEEISAIVETAHQMDVPVAAHISSLSDLELILAAGVDDFSHIVPQLIPEEVLEQMIINDIYWVPTLETTGGYDAGNIREFLNAGGHVALGNDSGMLPGIELGMPMREIEMMRAAGMTPMEIIVAATRNAAHVCNREELLGTLEVGKVADILVVNGDPLQDLQALNDVLLVIHHGVIVRDSTQK